MMQLSLQTHQMFLQIFQLNVKINVYLDHFAQIFIGIELVVNVGCFQVRVFQFHKTNIEESIKQDHTQKLTVMLLEYMNSQVLHQKCALIYLFIMQT